MPHELDQSSPHDEQRCARLAGLANVFAVTVVPLVDNAGDAREIPATEVFEQADLRQELHETPPRCHGVVRRLKQRPRPDRRDIGQAAGRPRRQEEFFEAGQSQLHGWMHASVWLAIIISSLVGIIHTNSGLSAVLLFCPPPRVAAWKSPPAQL